MLLFALLASALAGSATVTPTDVVSLQSAGLPSVSPDGKWLVLDVGGWSFDPDAGPSSATENGWTEARRVVRIPADGGEPVTLTAGPGLPGDAKWSPSGHEILFLRDVGGKSRIHLLPVAGGEARIVDTGELSPQDVAFSPDGSALRFRARPPKTDAEKAADFRTGGVTELEKSRAKARLYTVPATGGATEALTDGSVHVLDYTEAHEGGVFAITTSELNNAYENTIRPSLAILRDGAATPVPTSESSQACFGSVAFSPDDRELAWIGCRTGGITDALNVMDLRSGAVRNVLVDHDPTLEQVVWAPDGKSLLAQVAVKTRSELWRVAAGTGDVKRIPYDGTVLHGMVVSPDGKTLYVRDSGADHPPQVRSVALKSGRSTVLLDPNPGIASWALSRVEVVRWTGPEGTALEGVLTVPASPPDGGAPPLLVFPHGGPDSVTKEAFGAWDHFFGSHGYAVFHPNYRGGTAYGRDFYSANRGRLGEIEHMDIEAGVDHLIATGRVDPAKLYYGGWSWGGYLTAWAIGHSDRYRAAVAGAAVTDPVAQYVGSDINHGLVADWEYRGRPWADFSVFDRSNPSRFLASVRTPTLVLHGSDDLRVPFAQGVTLYRALADLGVETRFYVYPNEGHGLGAPAHRVHRLEVWLDWLESH
ncbi:MAG: S9 family peptidase [Myxococcota bacterium]